MFMQQNNKKGTRLVKTCKCGDEPIKLKKKKNGAKVQAINVSLELCV